MELFCCGFPELFHAVISTLQPRDIARLTLTSKAFTRIRSHQALVWQRNISLTHFCIRRMVILRYVMFHPEGWRWPTMHAVGYLHKGEPPNKLHLPPKAPFYVLLYDINTIDHVYPDLKCKYHACLEYIH